ncbi:MAG: Uncharacterised protein [Opitutia bacterium UBA7350]|nr:MAG: Uncharacterised protein [Opitutae bacterium UBA7350]
MACQAAVLGRNLEKIYEFPNITGSVFYSGGGKR